MANLMHIFMNNPTVGGVDGTQVSEEHTLTSPISATLTVTATAGASAAIKCALRCDAGYQTTGNVLLSLYSYDNSTGNYTAGGGNTGNVKLAADNGYTDAAAALAGAAWSDHLAISDVIGATNVIFWVKMSAAAGDTPVRDTSVAIHHEETVEVSG